MHLRVGGDGRSLLQDPRTSAWEESRRTKRGGERSSDVFVHVGSSLHTCIHLCTCSPVYSCLPAYTCAYLCIHVFTPVLICTCAHLGSLVYTCLSVNTNAHLSTPIFICVYLCTHVYTCAHPHIPVRLKPSVVNLGCVMYLTCILEPLK